MAKADYLETEVKMFKAKARGYNGTKVVEPGEVFEMRVIKGAPPHDWCEEIEASKTPAKNKSDKPESSEEPAEKNKKKP